MLSPELVSLLEPLERFESIRRRAARLGDRLADLSYANPYAGIQEPARNAIREALEERRSLDLQYSPFGGYVSVRRNVADALRSSHDLDFRFDDVVLTSGAMTALQVALRVAARPNGEVIVPVPCWLDYPLYVRSLGLDPVCVPLRAGTFDLDLDAIARAASERTVAVLLASPANPTGRVYNEAQLDELANVLNDIENSSGAAVTLISDEAHRDFAEPGCFQSPSSRFDRTLIVYSFGKYHFMQGQRAGYLAVSPRHPSREAISSEIVRWTRILGMVSPTSVMQRAIPKLLVLRHDQRWLLTWRKRFVDELTSMGYSVVRPDGTLFVYVRLPQDLDDFAFTQELARAGLLVLPAPIFHHTGYFRLSLTGTDSMLERALSVLRTFGHQ
jgi:aspartate/methionine/tyrosine aminotransferase